MSVILELSNVYSSIQSGLPEKVIKQISDACSYYQTGYNANTHSETKIKCSLFNESNFKFPTGLYSRINGTLKSLGYKVKIRDYRTRPKIDIDQFMKDMLDKCDEFGYALRDYQIDGILSAIEEPSGIFNWATGAGKTMAFNFLLLAYDLNSLILVNRKELAEQIQEELSKATGRTIGLIGDGVWSPSKWTVAIIDTLNEGLNHKSEGHKIRTLRFLQRIEMFIGDEFHHMGAKTWKDVARALENASVRFGFSGTPFHPDSEDLYLVGFTGEVISEVTPSDLIDQGYLAQPYIYMPTIPLPKEYRYKKFNWHQTRKFLLRENRLVNESGVEFIWKMYKKGISCIYFAGDDVEYGKIIHDMCLEAGVLGRDIRYMSGREPTAVRRKTLADFKNHQFAILGGTSIYDEGIDVPHTGAGANFGEGFSEIKTTQRIGRILRKTRPENSIDVNVKDKQIKYYWDPYNDGNKITQKHSDFRRDLYRSHKSFKLFERQYGHKG